MWSRKVLDFNLQLTLHTWSLYWLRFQFESQTRQTYFNRSYRQFFFLFSYLLFTSTCLQLLFLPSKLIKMETLDDCHFYLYFGRGGVDSEKWFNDDEIIVSKLHFTLCHCRPPWWLFRMFVIVIDGMKRKENCHWKKLFWSPSASATSCNNLEKVLPLGRSLPLPLLLVLLYRFSLVVAVF